MIMIKDLSVIYRGGYKALENISVEIPSNKITCILGPNGAGKTTLLKAISKIVDYSGKIFLNGIEVAREPLKTIAKIVSYASQIYVHELLSLTVREALLIARYPVSQSFFESEEDYRIVNSVAEQLLLLDYMDRRLSELSSGELQRVILAIALVKNPRILLFDELDSHIDIGVKSLLTRLIRKWVHNRVLIITTHDVLYGTFIGDYFIVLSNGSIVFKGDLERLVKNKSLLEKVYGVKIMVTKYSGRSFLIPLYT